MELVSIAAGVVILAATIRDMFMTLFVPQGHGRFSKWFSHILWSGFRRSERLIGLAGPLIPVIVILVWAVALVIGWALVYLPLLPDHYTFPDDFTSDQRTGFATAVYISIVTLTTLGFGDIFPESDVMRILTPIEALMGFAILTASLSWFVSVYSILSNQRGLARQIGFLRAAECRSGTAVERLDSQSSSAIYAELASGLVIVLNDLVQYPTSYYFHGRDDEANLSYMLPFLDELAQRGQQPGLDQALRFHAMELAATLEKTCEVLGEQYFSDGSLPYDEVISRFRRDHYPRG